MPSSYDVSGGYSLIIAQPREMVVQQFEDLDHHNTYRVHKGLSWQVLEENDDGRLIRVGKKTGRLYWKDEALLLHILSGQGKGTTIYHRFNEISPTETEVEMSFETPLPVFLCFLAPLIRWAVIRDIKRGLAEDKKDLEEHGYPRAAPQ